MNELLNFTNSWFVVEQNWVWMIAAFAIGIFVGWYTYGPDRSAA